jgi:hypothetical protein
MLTVFGACAVTFMMVMYALEGRDRRFVLAFAVGCALSSVYGFLAGTWPFGVVEAIWSIIAMKRYLDLRSAGDAARPRNADSSGRRTSADSELSTAIDSRRADSS